jgi:hypothetical protein
MGVVNLWLTTYVNSWEYFDFYTDVTVLCCLIKTLAIQTRLSLFQLLVQLMAPILSAAVWVAACLVLWNKWQYFYSNKKLSDILIHKICNGIRNSYLVVSYQFVTCITGAYFVQPCKLSIKLHCYCIQQCLHCSGLIYLFYLF